MTSFRQIEANRRNALRSHGPTTQAGKYRSRQNAVRHGLCAETVVGLLEDVDDYKGFEAAMTAIEMVNLLNKLPASTPNSTSTPKGILP